MVGQIGVPKRAPNQAVGNGRQAVGNGRQSISNGCQADEKAVKVPTNKHKFFRKLIGWLT